VTTSFVGEAHFLHYLTHTVDKFALAGYYCCGGVRERGFDEFCHARGLEQVVGGEEFDVLPLGFGHDIVPATEHPVIVFGANNSETLVVIFGQQSRSTIGAGVIVDDDLDIWVSLGECRVECLAQIIGAVEGWDKN
jgi:hypothetical protein